MSAKKFFVALEYYDALESWVRDHEEASYEEYVEARDQLRRKFGLFGFMVKMRVELEKREA